MPEVPLRIDQVSEFITQGRDSGVSEHPDGDKIYKEPVFPPKTEEQAERLHIQQGVDFYLSKVLHGLYPNFIPDIHLASIGKEDQNDWTGTETGPQSIHQKIEGETLSAGEYPELLPHVKNITDLGIRMDLQHGGNFIKNEQGTFYVDQFEIRINTVDEITQLVAKIEHTIDASEATNKPMLKKYLGRLKHYLTERNQQGYGLDNAIEI